MLAFSPPLAQFVPVTKLTAAAFHGVSPVLTFSLLGQRARPQLEEDRAACVAVAITLVG